MPAKRDSTPAARSAEGLLPEVRPPRVAIEAVSPEIDGGRFPAKSSIGEEFVVEADIFADGHDLLAAVLTMREESAEDWTEYALEPLVNDRWRACVALQTEGWYEYTIRAWIDAFATWRRDLAKKAEAGQEIANELREGAILLREAAGAAEEPDAQWLGRRAELLLGEDQDAAVAAALDAGLAARMSRWGRRSSCAEYGQRLRLRVERERARHGAWYEIFPRSCGEEPGRHGTFDDLARRLPDIAAMGFDVLYLPPIHPIGRAFRKGRNNSLEAADGDPGSPWAIGAAEGGHTAIHPELGTFDDFARLVSAAEDQGLEIALDIAFQCAPDHPYVREHPEWFKHRPDGTIKYAENPPKKYQDIYPLDFECDDWQNLWRELRDVVLFWAARGVTIFRVDNPHTKPFRFWEWLIAGVQAEYPGSIFLSEAFTRPKVMKHLAKAGFTQSYTYFTWRDTKRGLEEYFTELNQTDMRHYLRPNLFVNTPDILPEALQEGGPAAFHIRLILAATLGASYGIYGPPFENFEGTPIEPGKEEYLDSEKYQLRHWNWDRPNPFREFIGLVNRIRRENPALQFDHRLRFHACDNAEIIFFSKKAPHDADAVLVAVNLDPFNTQSGWLRVPLEELGFADGESFQVRDLITGAHYTWHGPDNFVVLDPHQVPAHILKVRKHSRTERDFDYFA